MEHLHFLFRQYLTQPLRHLLRFAHRIDDDARAAASLHFLGQEIGQFFRCQAHRLHIPGGRIQRDGLLLHLCTVRPCQQRIAAAGFPRRIRAGAALLLVSLDQLCTPPGGQSGRQQDHRHLVPAQPFQRTVQIAVHVRIVSVAFVHDHHLARKAQMPQHHMLLAQSRHQQLVYRADDKVCQQRLLAAPEPLMHLHPLLFCFRVVPVVLHPHRPLLQADILFVQFRHAVRKPDRSGQVIRLIFCPLQQTRKKPVCRCLRGQTKEDAARSKACRQNFRCRQRRLGLAHAHLCFQNQNARCIHGVGGFHSRLLHRIWGKAKPLCKFLRLCNAGLRRPG